MAFVVQWMSFSLIEFLGTVWGRRGLKNGVRSRSSSPSPPHLAGRRFLVCFVKKLVYTKRERPNEMWLLAIYKCFEWNRLRHVTLLSHVPIFDFPAVSVLARQSSNTQRSIRHLAQPCLETGRPPVRNQYCPLPYCARAPAGSWVGQCDAGPAHRRANSLGFSRLNPSDHLPLLLQ